MKIYGGVFLSCPVLLVFPVEDFSVFMSETWTPECPNVCIANSNMREYCRAVVFLLLCRPFLIIERKSKLFPTIFKVPSCFKRILIFFSFNPFLTVRLISELWSSARGRGSCVVVHTAVEMQACTAALTCYRSPQGKRIQWVLHRENTFLCPFMG